MRGVYDRQINQDCTAYQAFKDLVNSAGTVPIDSKVAVFGKVEGEVAGRCGHGVSDLEILWL